LLAVRLGKLGSDGDAKVRASAIGTATVVASPDGLLYAGIGLDNATVIVATADSDALMQALQALKVAR
jgi:hypothetical protein